MRKTLILSVLVFVLVAQLSWAQIPQTMSYQGTLTDTGSTPVADDNYDITFKLYNVVTGGTELWTETQSVPVANGVFNVILGSTVPLDIPFDQQYWLGVTVGAGSELEPRTQLTSAAYSLNSRSAGAHDHAGETWTGDGTGTGLTLENQNIGLSATGVETGITAHSTTGPAIVAVAGESSASTVGGDLSPSEGTNIGILGRGNTHGVVGEGGTPIATGVKGKSTNGTGVLGSSTNGTGVQARSIGGAGLWAESINDYGIAAQGGRGAAWLNGDVIVKGEVYAKSLHVRDASDKSVFEVGADGEIYARSFHTKNASDQNTSGVDTDGNASFNDLDCNGFNCSGLGGFDSFDCSGPGSFGSLDCNGLGSFNSLDCSGSANFNGLDCNGLGSFDSFDCSGSANFNGLDCSGLGSFDSFDCSGSANFNGLDCSGLGSFGSLDCQNAAIDNIASAGGLTVPTTTGGTIVISPLGIYIYNSSMTLIAWWCFVTGNIHVTGDLEADGAKPAVVPTMSYGRRKLYADESAEIRFFDRGEGQLINGEVTIELEPIFAETVTIDQANPMLVQTTPTSDCNGLYVAQRTSTSFTVRELGGGTSDAGFMWEVGAKRKGYEDTRLEEASEMMASLAARAE